jgi:hypothetical protein
MEWGMEKHMKNTRGIWNKGRCNRGKLETLK